MLMQPLLCCVELVLFYMSGPFISLVDLRFMIIVTPINLCCRLGLTALTAAASLPSPHTYIDTCTHIRHTHASRSLLLPRQHRCLNVLHLVAQRATCYLVLLVHVIICVSVCVSCR